MMKAEEAGSKRPSILRSGKSAPTPRPSSVKFNESVLARTESGDVLMVQLHAVAACNILDNAQWNSDDDYDVFLDSGKDQPASPLLPDDPDIGSDVLQMTSTPANDDDSDSDSSVVIVGGSDEEPAGGDVIAAEISVSTTRSSLMMQTLRRDRMQALKALRTPSSPSSLRERRLELLASIRRNREAGDEPTQAPVDSVDKSIQHEAVPEISFNDGVDLGPLALDRQEIVEVRTSACAETGRLLSLQFVYTLSGRCRQRYEGRLCGRQVAGSHSDTLVLRPLEYIVAFTSHGAADAVSGITVDTSDGRTASFGLPSEICNRDHRSVCGNEEAGMRTWEGHTGALVALSGTFRQDRIVRLGPIFRAWPATTFIAVCLLRQPRIRGCSDEERAVVASWARARALVGVGTMPGVVWVHDDERPNCRSCSEPFSWWHRKHHCRICGDVFCSTCCGTFQFVSVYLPCLDDRDQPQRLCNSCSSMNNAVWEIVRQEPLARSLRV